MLVNPCAEIMALRLQSSPDETEHDDNSGSHEKMTAFSVVRKKTPFQKHREEEEAKKKRADEEAARLYEEFVESFKADDVPGNKAFVRGGVINPNDRSKSSSENTVPKEQSSTKKPGTRYVPSFIPPGLAAIVNKDKESDKKKDEEKVKEKDRGKSRNIDNFMEELKREQEMREKRNQEREYRQRDGKPRGNSTPPSRFDELPDDLDPNGKLPGSFDDGDPQTTNLYVGNLSPQVDENFLLRTFGRFGPVASVKIMWPRTEEERRRQRNCGFVAFMNRIEAQAAKDEMQGVVVYEYELRIGWGKAVALPAQALPAPPPGQMAIRSKEGGSTANVAWSGPGAPPASAVSAQNTEVVLTPNVPDIKVVPPVDDHIRHVIDTMAMYVLDDGCAFEQAIMERGRGNSLFSFLFDLGSPEHTYYVWRLYSFAQGDTLQRWRTEPFIMVTGSGRWIPPPLPHQDACKSPEHEKTSTFAAGRGRRENLERALTENQRDEFEDMLRGLTLEKSQIRDAMGFALDNSDACGEVVDVLTESLTIKETPIPTKVARLMLVSDILHNSSAPVKNASSYRTGFEARLPDIMESFNDLYRNITGRITAEALKERVLKVLQVWADWFLFSDAYVNGLKATFLRPGNTGVPSFHTLCGDAPPAGIEEDMNTEEGKGHHAAVAICEGPAASELLSLPIAELERRCRHNGLSIRGGREIMVARLLSMEGAEKQKHQDEETRIGVFSSSRGRPSGRWAAEIGSDRYQGQRHSSVGSDEEFRMSKEAGSIAAPVVKGSGIKTEIVLPASKWTREDDGSDEEDKQDDKSLGIGYSSGSDEIITSATKRERFQKRMESARDDLSMDEERRQKLRKLEVSVMEYRESLEERGLRNSEEIERKVMQQRKKLESDYGLEDTPSRSTGSMERRDRRDDRRDRKRTRSRSRSRSRSPSGVRDRSRDRDRDRKEKRDESRDRDRDKKSRRS